MGKTAGTGLLPLVRVAERFVTVFLDVVVTSVLVQLNTQLTFLGFIYEKQWFP